MLGSATPVLGWLYAWAPPFRLFRICERYVFLVQVAVSVLAAHGVEALSEVRPLRPAIPSATSLALPMLAVALVVVVAARHAAAAPRLAEDMHWLLLGGGATLLLAVAIAVRPASSAALGAAMALVVAVDLGVMARRAGVLHPGTFDARSSVVSDAWVTRMQSEGDTVASTTSSGSGGAPDRGWACATSGATSSP